MTENKNQDPYILLTRINGNGELASLDGANAVWSVSLARAAEGSTIERAHADRSTFYSDIEAVGDFFSRLDETGLPAVLDLPEIRIWRDGPEAVKDFLSEEIHDDIEEGAASANFDAHPLSRLHAVMSDWIDERTGNLADRNTPEP